MKSFKRKLQTYDFKERLHIFKNPNTPKKIVIFQATPKWEYLDVKIAQKLK